MLIKFKTDGTTFCSDTCERIIPTHLADLKQYPQHVLQLVMGGIENFLSRLLKDKIPRYHGILPYSDL